jgi:dTDP-4-dehydrorhamnose reductase
MAARTKVSSESCGSSEGRGEGVALILGAGGMLGQALLAELSNRGRSHLGKTRAELDLTDSEGIRGVVQSHGIKTVYNAAAFTDVDQCEERREHALEVNGHAVGRLARICAEASVRLVHVSSDYVFGEQGAGRSRTPIPIDAATAPDSVYGESKLLGESLALEHGAPLVVRASWLFGPGGRNFAHTIAMAAAERDELRVVNDQRGAPTYTPFLAHALVELEHRGTSGIWHYRNRPSATWYDFACAIVTVTGADCRVVPVTTEEFPRPAKRPSYSVLDIEQTERELGTLEPWSLGLERYHTLLLGEG